MAYTSEIEKLEKRWAENPKGRNFAPLADAYRKAGELDRAIELCTAGLALHPDYVSAHIVYARCLMDQKNDPGAADVFQKVLTLDPENVLALKILGEIAERGGRYDEAVTWLTRLLGADPMNGEAAEHLSRAKSRAAGQGGASAAPAATAAASSQTATLAAGATRARPPLAATAPSPRVALGAATTPGAHKTAEPATPRMPDRAAPRAPAPRAPSPPAPPAPPPPAATLGLVLEHLSEPSAPSATGAGAGADKRASAGIETFDGSLNFDAVAHEAAKADGLEVEEEVELTPQDLVVEGLAPTQFESIAPSPDIAPAAPAAPAKAGDHLGAPAHEELLELLAPDADSGPTVDLPLIMPDDEETVAAAPPAPPPPPPGPRRTAASTPPRPSPPPPPLPAPPPPAAVALSDDDGAADTEMLSRAEPVVTETMAELYLRQGHADDALRVYQALLAQRPGDARLQARVARLTGGGASTATGALGGGSGESVEAFLRRILAGRPRPEGAEALLESPRIEDHPASPEPEAEPLGSALDGAFGIAPMEPEPRPDVQAPGEATRPAADTISLDAVFGDETRSSLPTLPRAVPPASGTLASAEEPPPPPSEAPASSASGVSSTGGFSFDQFFGPSVARAEGGAPAGESASGGGGASPQRTSGAKPRVPAEDEADLDQFQAWLRGLKS